MIFKNILHEKFNERKQRRQKITSLINQTREVFDSYGSEKLQSHTSDFDQIINALDSDEVRLVVLGEFSRGKSLLINALLDMPLLRSATEATTAINTFVNGLPEGEKQPYINIHYHDNNKPPQRLPYTDDQVLERWGTELDTQNKDARKEVEKIEVFTNHTLLQQGLVLVDTPGLESVVEHHELITRKAITDSHIAIWVQSADQLGGNSREWGFLRQTIQQNFRKFLTVVNKWDKVLEPDDDHEKELTENERSEKKMEVVRRNFSDNAPTDGEELAILTSPENLMGISALWALKKDNNLRKRSGIDKLASRIAQMMNSGEAEEEIFYAPLKKLTSHQSRLNHALQDEQTNLNADKSLQERQREIEHLEQEIKNQELEQKQVEYESKEEHKRVAESLITEIKQQLSEPLENLRNELEDLLTENWVASQIDRGVKKIQYPENLQVQIEKINMNVDEGWKQKCKTMQEKLADLRESYQQQMQEQGLQLEQQVGGLNLKLDEFNVAFDIDLKELGKHQQQYNDLVSQQQRLEDEMDEIDSAIQLDQRKEKKLMSKKNRYQLKSEQIQNQLVELGSPPAPIRNTDRIKTSDWGSGPLWLLPTYENITIYDHSNVRAHEKREQNLMGNGAINEKNIDKIIKKIEQHEDKIESKKMLRRKAERALKRREKETEKKNQQYLQQRQNQINEELTRLKRTTLNQINQQLKLLDQELVTMVQFVFDSQLSSLIQAVEEKFNEPLQAVYQNRKQALELMEQDEEQLRIRSETVQSAMTKLQEIQQQTELALQGKT